MYTQQRPNDSHSSPVFIKLSRQVCLQLLTIMQDVSIHSPTQSSVNVVSSQVVLRFTLLCSLVKAQITRRFGKSPQHHANDQAHHSHS